MKALTVERDYEHYLGTVAEMLTAEGMTEAAAVLRTAVLRIAETGFDNWNGGTTIWTIYLSVSPSRYAVLGAKRESIEEQINKRLKPVIEQFTSDWCSVSIVPAVEARPEWRETSESVSRETRQSIFDGLKIDKVAWSGRLEEVEFLGRMFDLQALPSFDPRYPDAARDIWQHRINNREDWPDDWIYDDKRFNLQRGSTEQFLRFLCEMVHPVVRPDRDEAIRLVRQFNDQLQQEGWQLVQQEKIAGRPRFVADRIRHGGGRSISRARSVADALDAGWMQKEIERVENAIDRDPALAIGSAKELVESCCKSILGKLGVEVSRSADLPTLTKLLAKELQLIPEGIPDAAKGAETIKLILRNLASLTQYVAELRGLYGTGHGRDGKHRGLEPRHARLAVGAAVAFIDFVTDTYHRRIEKSQGAIGARD